MGGGGVDGAIHRAAGPQLLAACRQLPETEGVRCAFGEARITAAGKLNARFVIHAVGPIYAQSPAPEKTLASAYSCALNLAVKEGCESVALPAISCGVYGYPHEAAARIAIDACSQERFTQLSLTFYLFSETLLTYFSDALKAVILRS